MKKIDYTQWKRKEHFEFFAGFEDPSFGIMSEIECTSAYTFCKENKHSFFAYYLHRALLATQDVEEFRYRILDGDVVIFDEIHAGPTIARDDGTFGFSFIAFNPDFQLFSNALDQEIENVKNSSGLRKSVDGERVNVIYFSTLPWVSITALKHPFSSMEKGGIPKITFGKMFTREERYFLPVSIQAHHGLIDGLHVANYLESFQKLLQE